LRADPALRDVPVILLSARAGEDSTIEGLEAGADDYLVKPFAARELLARVRTHVELARQREAVARAKDAAEAANRELEAFSYSVAHDLRAPLRSIDGFSQTLLEDYADKLDADGKKYFSFIRESAQHMAQLIDDLLALSRVTRSELHREGVDLSALARAAITRLQRSQPDRRVDVVIQEGLRGEGDPRLLAVVLDNLFGNAWKFSGRRDEARIEFGATSNDGQRVYFVRDNGAGFDMAFADKLFGVFQRLHAAAEFEGTGIGLATVQRVVRRHGGRVWAEGEVNRGATFFFTLYEKNDFD
jgi:light-regulated signal transduction histidine kinase (bacteriophytochrome)